MASCFRQITDFQLLQNIITIKPTYLTKIKLLKIKYLVLIS